MSRPPDDLLTILDKNVVFDYDPAPLSENHELE